MADNENAPSEKFGAMPIDGFKAVDPTDHLPHTIEVKSADEKRQLLEGAMKAAEEKRQKGDIAGAIKELLAFGKQFMPL